MRSSSNRLSRADLCAAMHSFDIGLETPDEGLPLFDFLAESTVFLSELFLGEALIDATDPFEDEVITGGLLCCVVASGLSRIFKCSPDEVATLAFHHIYGWAFRDKPDEKVIAWSVSQRLFNKLLDQTTILEDIDARIFYFYSTKSKDALASVGLAAEALRKAIDS